MTNSGLYRGEDGEDICQYGEVVGVGGGRRNNDGTLCPMEVEKGDTVAFGFYSGDSILVDEDGGIYKFVNNAVPEDRLHVKILSQDAILFRL